MHHHSTGASEIKFILIFAVIGITVLFATFLFMPWNASPSDTMDVAYTSRLETDPAPAVVPEAVQEAAPQTETSDDKQDVAITSEDFAEVARACIRGDKPREVMISLLRHPNQMTRIAFVRALGEQSSRDYENHTAFLALWDTLDAAQLDVFTHALLETLELDTKEHRLSHAPYMLTLTGQTGDDTIQALMWSSNNHDSPEMRVWTMNTVHRLKPGSEESKAIIHQRLKDPSSHVRLQALQAWILDPFNARLQDD